MITLFKGQLHLKSGNLDLFLEDLAELLKHHTDPTKENVTSVGVDVTYKASEDKTHREAGKK